MKQVLQVVGGYGKQRYSLLVWAGWLVLFVEFLSRGSLLATLAWASVHFPLFLLNSLLLGFVLFLLTAVTGHARISLALLAILSLVPAYASGVKLRMLGMPLLPWDLGLIGEAGDVIAVKDLVSLTMAAETLGFLAVGGFLLYRLTRPERMTWRERAIGAAAALCLIAGTFAPGPVSLSRLFGTRSLPDDQAQNVRTNGFVMAEMLNLKVISARRTALADSGAALALAALNQPEPKPETAVKPNIIVLLSESLWDPTNLKQVTFSQDPLPFLHSLQQQYPSGTMLSPQFGGDTANVELEVLTGLSMRFLPQGSLPYNQYINRPVDSLASILARQGYATSAITPWPNWFFSNNKVYRYFGFGRLLTLEYMRKEYKGGSIADREIGNLIIAETEKSAGPHFVFANTGENHYPWEPGKYPENTIAVKGLPEASTDILETYAQGCLDADKMLRQLVDHFTATKQPTIILFFGDHLPVLGKNYGVYKDAGYIHGEDDPDFPEKIHRTPVLIWDNYLPPHPEHIDLSPSFLSPYLLELAGQPGTSFTNYLRDLSRRIPVIPPRSSWAAAHITESDLQQYEALENDILFGDQKAYGDLKDPIIDPNYELGYGPIVIDRAAVAAGALTLQGQNFPEQGSLYLGGTALDFTWQDDHTLTAQIPANLATQGAEVQVRLYDNQKTLIAQSNKMVLSQAQPLSE